ncbi:MAG: hypothetical protein WC299_14240 [Kiritimatiellia bacterium]
MNTYASNRGPWLRYRDTGLYVLPYRHCALEFAALPFLAGIRQFDKVCLELPAWLPVDSVGDAIAAVAPGVGAILIPAADPVSMLVPEYAGDPNPIARKVFSSALLPITQDAMMSVLRIVRVDPENSPRVEFVDADMPIEAFARDETGSSFPHMDAQEAAERGLAEWYSRWQPLLRSYPRTPRDAYREAFMALRLIESVLRPGCKALFVCGAMHWHRIEALLDAGNPDDLRWLLERLAPVPAKQRFTSCSLDPSVLHSLRLMDIPHVAQEFERDLAAGTLRVDRPEWIRRMIVSCWKRSGRPVSPRTLAVMDIFLSRRLLSDARWSCDLDRHLLPSALAAAGRSFAHELEQEAMRYDIKSSGNPPQGRVVPFAGRALLIFLNSEVHLIELPRSANADGQKGRPLRMRRTGELTAKERKAVNREGLRMKPPCEELLHRHMCDTARRLGHDSIPFRRRHRPHRFCGNLGRGPDARRSIRAWACGDNTLYVRHPCRIPKRQTDCDECPVVWVFHGFKRVVKRETDFFADNSRGQRLLSSFFWFYENKYVDPISINRIAWFVRLYRNLTPSWDKELVERKLIRCLPPEKFCTVRPWDDGDLPFDSDDPDLAVACAVKWSVCDHVIVVRVDASYRIGDRARAFARDRNIRLLEPDGAGFDRIRLNRYELDHEVPTRGAWHPPDPLAVRMVPSVPGFDPLPGSDLSQKMNDVNQVGTRDISMR